MKYSRIISLLAASTMLVTFSAHAYDKDGDKAYKPKKAAPMQRYTLTGGATYLIPSVDGLDFASTKTVAAPFETKTYSIDPSYNWGYFLAFGYMISSKYDIQASWQQYNSESSDSLSATADVTMVSSNLLDITTPAEAKTREELKTQAFDATLGQYHKLSRTLTARPFVGVKYAKVDDNTSNTYTESTGAVYSETFNSSFSGVGPELGMDVEYGVYQQLGVVGHLAASFLIGNQDTSGTAWDEQNDVQAPYKSSDDTRLVPALDAKLGLTWDSLYANKSFGIGLEAGYQVAYYFNAVEQVQSNAASTISTKSDVGIMGPYMNVSAMF